MAFCRVDILGRELNIRGSLQIDAWRFVDLSSAYFHHLLQQYQADFGDCGICSAVLMIAF